MYAQHDPDYAIIRDHSLKIYAAFLPQSLEYTSGDVCVVIDAVRAGASLVAMAEAGDPLVYLAEDTQQARQLRDTYRPQALLGGEKGGLTPPGFDLGNSPQEWSTRALGGEEVVFGTTNGTRAIALCSGASHVLVASFNNVSAVALRARVLADRCVKIVCAGQGGLLALDDAVCAGLIVRQFVQEHDCVADSAVMAMALADQFDDINWVMRNSESGRRLLDIGYESDLDWCGRVDSSQKVPELAKGEVTAHSRLALLQDSRGT